MNKSKKIWITITVIVLVFLVSCTALQLHSAGFQRFKRNLKSEYTGGIERRITIYNSGGEKIFQLEGKFDFTYDDNCIEYIDTNTNLKHNIFAGDNATVIIDEIK